MIRVTRILTYTYADEETYLDDQARWYLGVSRTSRPNPRITIRSAALPAEYVEGPEGPPAFGKPDHEQLVKLLGEHGTDDPNGMADVISRLFGYEP